MPEVVKQSPQVEKFQEQIYPRLREAMEALLTPKDEITKAQNWLESPKPETILSAFDTFKTTANAFFNLLTASEDQKALAKAVVSGRNEQIAEELHELYAQHFDFGDSDYFSVIKGVYESFAEQYSGMLPDKTPKTFEDLIKTTLADRTKEVLEGKTAVVLPGAIESKPAEKPVVETKPDEPGTKEKKEAQAPPISRPQKEDDSDFEEWQKGWFEDNPDEEDFAKYKYTVTAEHIGDNIKDFNGLRDVALQKIRMMYMTNEIDEESDRRIRFDDIITKAEVLAGGNKEKQKYVDYARYMINGMRELNLYWLNHWIGTTGNGIGVKMESIATGAAEIPDAPQGYISFLMKEKAVMAAYHTEILRGGLEGAHKKLSGGEERSALAKIIGYRLRRMTGQAIYDGIRKLNHNDWTKIAEIIEAGQQGPQLNQNLSEEAKTTTYLEFNNSFENQLANAVFGVNSEIKPHTVDYQLFLNHFIPWYLNVRYREKFKTMADTMYRRSRHIHEEFKAEGYLGEAIPGLLTREDYEKLGQTLESEFDHFNLGEIGAYSLWKRPDTSGQWIENLKLIAFVGSAHFGGIDLEKEKSLLKEKIPSFDKIDSSNAEEMKIRKEIALIDNARKRYQELQDEFSNKADLEGFLKRGADFGMKLLSIYDAEHDTRAKQDEVNRNWGWKFGVTDWSWKNLESLSDSQKFDVLRKFLDEKQVKNTVQHEIIRNNLIRTVPINEELKDKLRMTSPQFQGYFDTNIYEEFIDIDSLYFKGSGDRYGESWMRFFDTSKFSHNAFVIYEGYASKTREIIHQIFDVTTPIPDHFKLKETLQSAKAFKHNVDTALAVVSPETGYKEYKHAVAWRIEKTLNAIEDYVSSMYMLSIYSYRKTGARVELAEQMNGMVQQGVKEHFFKKHHFEPAMSSRQKGEGIEFSYNEITTHGKMGNDYKLRVILNQCGFADDALKDCKGSEIKSDVQRAVWEKGFLKNINDGKASGDPEVLYDVFLLMAGLKERQGKISPGEVRGYELDGEVADRWYGFYLKNRNRGDLAPGLEALLSDDQYMPEGQKFIPLLLERARKIPAYSDKAKISDEQVLISITRQFEILNNTFEDNVLGLFTNYMLYQRNVMIVWEKVVDAFVQNTFDKSRKYMSDVYIKNEEWPDREWDSRIDYMRREAFKCFLLRKRKYAIKDENEAFNRFILTQARPDGKSLHQPYDRDNWEIDVEKGTQKMLDLAGTDEIESVLLGSGEMDFGLAKRLTRLPNYWDGEAYYRLYRTIFSTGIAIEAHNNSGELEWESGQLKTVRDKRVKLGPWTWVIDPEKWYNLTWELRDPGGQAVLGWSDITHINERDGTTREQVEKFVEERNWRKVEDLEVGLDKQLHDEEKENAGTLDSIQSFILEIPGKSPVTSEIGGLFNLGGIKKKLSEAGSLGKSAVTANMLTAGLMTTGAAIAVGSVLPFLGLALLTLPIVNLTLNINDVDEAKRGPFTKFLFDTKIFGKRFWKHQAMGPSKITIPLPFGILGGKIESNWHFIHMPLLGGTIMGSVKNVREMGRDSEVMLRGKVPVWDSLVNINDIIKDFKDNKQKLRTDSPKSLGGEGH
jgi:hypothetical protein